MRVRFLEMDEFFLLVVWVVEVFNYYKMVLQMMKFSVSLD